MKVYEAITNIKEDYLYCYVIAENEEKTKALARNQFKKYEEQEKKAHPHKDFSWCFNILHITQVADVADALLVSYPSVARWIGPPINRGE